MYPVAVVGSNPTARAAILACRRSGFEDITWLSTNNQSQIPATTLPANLSRIINILGNAQDLLNLGRVPDREQIRFAASGFLLSELPLGKFTQDRYGAPHVNVEYVDLDAVLELTVEPHTERSVKELERTHGVVLVCTPPTQHSTACTHEIWLAQMPIDPDTSNVNITWLGHGQTAWQFSTARYTNYLFSTPVNVALKPAAWHPSLHDAITAASLVGKFDSTLGEVRQHWHEGNVAYLGDACYSANVYARESRDLGLEDAWVLSRMLENYEEDIQDGLREYAKYRRPRAKRVLRNAIASGAQQSLNAPLSRLTHTLNIAFSTRFLPEIAMQRIDWLYDYDCIRGFR